MAGGDGLGDAPQLGQSVGAPPGGAFTHVSFANVVVEVGSGVVVAFGA